MVANVAVRPEATNAEASSARLPRRLGEQNAGAAGFGESLQQHMHPRAMTNATARSSATDQPATADDKPKATKTQAKSRDCGDATSHEASVKSRPKRNCGDDEPTKDAAAIRDDDTDCPTPTGEAGPGKCSAVESGEGKPVDTATEQASDKGPTTDEILAIQADLVPVPVASTTPVTTETGFSPDTIVSADGADLVPGYVEMLASAAGADIETGMPVNTGADAAAIETPDAVSIAAIPAVVTSGAGDMETAATAGAGAAQVETSNAAPTKAPTAMPVNAEQAESVETKAAAAQGATASAVSTPSTSTATSESKGNGEAVSDAAKAKNGEKASNEGGKPASTHARPAFAEWVSDFAQAQGAIHRSGDLVGALDRMTNPAATVAQGQGEALRPTPLQMLPIEIGMQAMRGATQFQIRLDPAELGRVDVKLEIRSNGEVHANLVVDRVETLAMLKRDASTLQYAFEQAGLKQSADGLTFSLRGEGQNGQHKQDGQGTPQGKQVADEDFLKLQNQISELAMRRVMIPHSSIDRVI